MRSERIRELYELEENVENAIGEIGRFRPGTNLSFGEMAVSPSNDYEAAWVEGTYSIGRPYLESQLHVSPAPVGRSSLFNVWYSGSLTQPSNPLVSLPFRSESSTRRGR